MPLVDVTRVAQALNLDERRIQQLVKEGLPREKRGEYDAVKCMLWYIRYLQAVIDKKAVNVGNQGFAGEREERVRLLRADADMREIEFAKERGQLIAVADVEAAVTDLVLTTKARVMAIAPQLAPELVGETSRVMIQAKIDKAHRKALSYLAKAANDGNPSERNHGAAGTVPSREIPATAKKNHAAEEAIERSQRAQDQAVRDTHVLSTSSCRFLRFSFIIESLRI